MQNIILRNVSVTCDSCGASNKKVYQHEYICMVCGVVDENIMMIDERSELKKQWEVSETDQNINKHTSSSRLPGFLRIGTSVTPADAAYRRAFVIAQKAARLFSVETDQIPSEATFMYMATKKSETGHVCSVEVIACTMIAAHRRTAQDIQDASLAFKLKFKNISSAIEYVHVLVMHGDKTLGDTYGYLFNSVSDRRPAELVKEAIDHLLELTASDRRGELLASAWGIRSLAEDMMNHVLDSRLTGGGSLQLLARSMIVMAIELFDLVATSGFISSCIMLIHRETWKVAAQMWPGGLKSLAQHVQRKRSMREYGCMSNKRTVHELTPKVQPVTSASILGKRHTREQVRQEFEADFVGRFYGLDGTATAAGVTHLCIFTANDPAVRKFLDQDKDQDQERMRTLMDVCLAAVRGTAYPVEIEASIVSTVTGVVGFQREVMVARRFHTIKLPKCGCFMPQVLMRWDTKAR